MNIKRTNAMKPGAQVKVRRLSFFLLLVAVAHSDLPVADAIEAEPTRFFLRRQDRLCQAISVAFEQRPEAPIEVCGTGYVDEIPARAAMRFQGRRLIPVPIVEETTTFQITCRDMIPATVRVKPERRWVVYVTPHTHLDVGFTDRQDRVWEAMAGNLSNVIRMCEETRDWPEGSQYRWTIEVSALFENFLKRAPSEEVSALLSLIREGRVELCGLYLNLLTELCGPEELCRSLYYSEKSRKEFAVPVETAIIDDVPGYTWALPALLTQAGLHFLSLRANPVRSRFLWWREGAVERPFIWEGPDGSRIPAWYTDSYREANALRGGWREDLWQQIESEPGHLGAYRVVLDYLEKVIATGYRFDVLQMRMGGDNMTAVLTPCLYAREWNRRFAYPKLVLATNRDFYQALEPHLSELQVYRGDIPDWWADGAASTARETGLNRILHDRALDVEKLAAMADLLSGTDWEYPREEITAAYRWMLLYDEHTWGSSRGGRNRDPAGAEEQWQIKQGYVHAAQENLKLAGQKVFQRLRECLETPAPGRLVFNTLSWERKNLRESRFLTGEPGPGDPWETWLNFARTQSEDRETGSLPSFGVLFLPVKDLQDHGQEKLIGRVPGDESAPNPVTRFADPSARHEFGQYIYETGGRREKIIPFPDPEEMVRSRKTYQTANMGPPEPAEAPIGERSLVSDGEGPGVHSLRQMLRYHEASGALRIENHLHKTDTHDPEGVYFSFPFDVADPEIHLEVPFAAMKPERDQLAYSARDFYSIQHWVDVSGPSRGFTFVAVEAPLVMIDRIRSDEWKDHMEVRNGHLYSYAMNNYWFTNYRFHQGGKVAFRYVVRPHEGPFDPVRATRFGWEATSPPYELEVPPANGRNLVRVPERLSLFTVKPDSVILLTLKRAEDGRGHIARLYEASGQPVHAAVAWHPDLQFNVFQTDIVENDIRDLPESDRSVEIDVPGFGVATLRLVGSGNGGS